MDSSETIVIKTVQSIVMLIEQLDPIQARQVKEQLRDWPSIWAQIRHLLITEPLRDRDTTLRSFAAKLVPDYGTFERDFCQSLTLHTDFWNKVYEHLMTAKSRVSL